MTIGDKGGDFYCKGASFQNLSKRQRRKLAEVIDGITYPLVGLDLKNFHLALMYWEREIPLPEGDLYELEDFDRDTTSKPGHLTDAERSSMTYSCRRAMVKHLHMSWARAGELDRSYP